MAGQEGFAGGDCVGGVESQGQLPDGVLADGEGIDIAGGEGWEEAETKLADLGPLKRYRSVWPVAHLLGGFANSLRRPALDARMAAERATRRAHADVRRVGDFP
jgi:hypothetical protein